MIYLFFQIATIPEIRARANILETGMPIKILAKPTSIKPNQTRTTVRMIFLVFDILIVFLSLNI
jgi:hypothetical protein